MADQRRYVLDASVFIDAHRRYYGFDLCPGFWTAMVRQHNVNRVFSIDRAKQEIAKGKDKLKKWTQLKVPDTFFKKTDAEAILDQFGKMSEWVQGEPQYTTAAKAEFARAADGWLIACARVNRLIVVTQEEYKSEAKATVPIPNVCRKFAVEYVDTFAMLRELHIRFGLQKRRSDT